MEAKAKEEGGEEEVGSSISDSTGFGLKTQTDFGDGDSASEVSCWFCCCISCYHWILVSLPWLDCVDRLGSVSVSLIKQAVVERESFWVFSSKGPDKKVNQFYLKGQMRHIMFWPQDHKF